MAHGGQWIIEANSTYRGWFVFFAGILGGVLKMGDTSSVGYLLSGASPDPGGGGWGGRVVRVWPNRKATFTRLTTPADEAEAARLRGAFPPHDTAGKGGQPTMRRQFACSAIVAAARFGVPFSCWRPAFTGK
jgi:hypothetical protein